MPIFEMKATITIDGRLRVVAESELESYALTRWQRDFDQGTHESILETMPIATCINATTTTETP